MQDISELQRVPLVEEPFSQRGGDRTQAAWQAPPTGNRTDKATKNK